MASEYLKEEVIIKYIEKLDKMLILPLDSKTLIESMHNDGINMRYLG